MASSRPRRCWRSSWRERSACRSRSCFGWRIKRLNLAYQVPLRRVDIGKVHAPAGDEEAQGANLAADPVGALVLRVGIGTDREIAARPVIDAAAGDETLGA